MAINNDGIKVNNENREIYFKFVCDPVLFFLFFRYIPARLLNMREKNILNSMRSKINNIWRLLPFKGTKPSLINVRKVIIPRKIQRNDDVIIQLKFFIILNILNNY